MSLGRFAFFREDHPASRVFLAAVDECARHGAIVEGEFVLAGAVGGVFYRLSVEVPKDDTHPKV